MSGPITEEHLQEFSRLLGLLSVTEEMDDEIARQGAALVAEVRRLQEEAARAKRREQQLLADLADVAASRNDALEEIEAWKGATGLERGGDPDAVRPADLGEFVASLVERVRVLEGALREAKGWMGDPEDPSGSFDELAERFRQATGCMAPGKYALGAIQSLSERRLSAWTAWCVGERARVWGIVHAALGGGQ